MFFFFSTIKQDKEEKQNNNKPKKWTRKIVCAVVCFVFCLALSYQDDCTHFPIPVESLDSIGMELAAIFILYTARSLSLGS